MALAASCTPTAGLSSGPGDFWPSCAVTTLPDRWARSPPPATTRPWSRSSRCCGRTSWTAGAGPTASRYAWRSSPGSKGRTTGADAKPDSADSPPSSTRRSTPLRSHSPPETDCHLSVQQSRGHPPGPAPTARTPGRDQTGIQGSHPYDGAGYSHAFLTWLTANACRTPSGSGCPTTSPTAWVRHDEPWRSRSRSGRAQPAASRARYEPTGPAAAPFTLPW